MRVLSVKARLANQPRTLATGAAPPGLAAYLTDGADDSGTIAGLLAELLLGAADPRWARSPWALGEARLSTAPGEVLLRRAGSASASRLTLAPAGATIDSRRPAPADWQAGLPPAVLASVFFTAPAPIDPLRPLLSAEVAEAFTRLANRHGGMAGSAQQSVHRRADELLRRRDDLAGRIEALLATRRHESSALDDQLKRLDADRDALAAQVDEFRLRVRALSEQLESEGARVRYEELSRVAAEAEGRQAADEWGPRVEELDEEVSRWRATLAELESREAYVRGELSRVRPDDAAPQILLADQRASIAVAQRLVADLESEVARFARSGDSPHCACDDAHPRLNPLVETLGRHVERLATLISQQDDALRTQELLAEAAQLDRSQAELRRQLDHLLERRQTLHRSSRARTTREGLPGVDYATRIDTDAVRRDHARLNEELRVLEAELAAHDRQREDTIERRRRLLHNDQLATWQRELDAVQAELARSVDLPLPQRGETLRASDVFARLTDGEFTALRLAPGGRLVEARNRTGRIVRQADLSTVEARLVAWALRLALADAAHNDEAAFPLVLDQPFADLDDRHAANLATCLDDYARRSRQVLVWSSEGAGLARLRGLGSITHRLTEEATAPSPEPVAPPRHDTIPRQVVREEVVTRAWLLDVDDPIERFPAPLENRAAAFARSRVRTLGELIDADPSAVAEEMAVEGLTAELVSLWQAHAALVCFTAGLDLPAAQLLVDCDILSVDQLAEADAERLVVALRKRGAAAAMLARVEEWVESAADGVSRWESTGYAERWRRNNRERRERIRTNAHRRESGGTRSSRLGNGRSERRERDHEGRRRTRRGERSSSRSSSSRSSRRSSSRGERSETKKLRFYLDTTSDIEAAPSIGSKRAQQLTALGVATVAQLLAADPEDLAARLDHKRIDAATIVAWQHQSGLMCAVPGLRGHDAQVLVGSGFASAEEIAAMKPTDLLEFVDPFCDTPDGQRALRGSARPDLAEVTQWIEGARQRRPVSVA